MKYLAPNNTLPRPARRTAALLCAALLGLGLGLAASRTSAQVTGPLTGTYASPPQPTPFQWQNYHSGGAPIPATQFPAAPDPNAALGLTPLIDPLQSQLQGTPTELYNGSLTQIPSFLLGNYDPTRPPTGLDLNGNLPFYPNHFQDGGIVPWSAPFSFVALGSGTVTVDDAPLTGPTYANGVATASGFTINPANGAFVSVTDPNGTAPGPTTSPAAATATGDEYLRLPPGVAGTAIWTLYEPAAGVYSVYFHIPNDLPDSTGAAEVRDTQVLYFVRVLDANGNVTTSTTATASQTEANDSQLLSGPFQVAAGGSVVVTLTRSLSNPVINYSPTQPYYLVADSMTLQQTVGDVQSAPTVVTRTSYPTDFNNVQYWGTYISPTVDATLSTSVNPATAAAANANPDTTTGDATGNILLKTGNPLTALGTTGIADPTREIRQLVYFGRSDPSASVTATVDDNGAGFSGNGTPVNNALTASNNEYRISTTANGTTGTTPAAIWTVPVPAAGVGSNFFVYAHIPATASGEIRLPHVFYSVEVTTATATGNVQTIYNAAISQQTQGTDALVVLPTGPLTPVAGTNIVVTMYNQNNLNAASPPGTVVVADSVNVSTGTGQGAIYCVDGFTGGVVWRFETPGSANGASAPVFASPVIAKINVIVTPATATTPAIYANKLVVIVGDNNGLVYCLDAIGNGDGTSNFDVLNPTTLQPITIPQPTYGTVVPPLAVGTPAATAALTAHVGTTGVYWIYRPDATQPKYVTGTAIGTVKPVDPTTDLPVPAAFNTASPVVFVDPTVSTTPNLTTGTLASNAKVYIGNSNGVLYALDALGASIDGSGVPTNGIGTPATFKTTGDSFNVSQDVQPGPFPKLVIPSAQPKWWFSLRGVDPNGAENPYSADIESAPALYINRTVNALAGTTTYVPTVYIGSAHEQEVTSNVGRLYALNGLYGPSGNNGRTSPLTQPDPTAGNYTGPGSFNYNVGQIPQVSKTDTADWSFPDGVGTTTYATGKSSDGNPRPALGNITGSPVVFTNIDETVSNPTRIYIAANSGLEPTAAVPVPPARPDDTQTGRVWAVNLDGSVGTTTNSGAAGNVWSYPVANNPNDKTKDNVAEPYPPIGSFLRGTPAIGFVQFPASMQFTPTAGGAVSNYSPVDQVHAGGIAGQSVPMLYIGTRGVNDSSLYAVDIDGEMTALPANVTTTTSGTAANDQRTIYRLVTPDGSIYQSSPALVTNATSAGGNGGSVYAVAGNSMYDYGATPISNPFAGNDFPLIPQNRVFVGLGPISSPALAGADASDYLSAQPFLNGTNTTGSLNNSGFKTLTVDWVIIGDSTSGLCRGITPNDPNYGGFVTDLLRQVPPDPNAPLTQLLTAEIQTFLLPDPTTLDRTSTKAEPVGATAPLPVYDWGESAYVAFTNVAPPNPPDANGQPNAALFVHDTVLYPAAVLATASSSNPIPFYTSNGTTAETVTFNLSDVDPTTGTTSVLQTDNGSVLPANYFVDPGSLTADANTPKFTQDVANVVQNLVANNGNRYLGTYTYTIGDGSARNNTPGARRRFQNVHQVVTEYDYENLAGDGDPNNFANYAPPKGNLVIGGDATSNNITPAPDGKSFLKIASVDQPTFGILNPLAVRGGGDNLLATGIPSAVPVGDEAGPFRSVNSSLDPLPTLSTQGTGDVLGLQALTNGNDVLAYAPPSSSGVGASPVALPNPATDPTAPGPTQTHVVVTTTGLIAHNSVGDNSEPRPTNAPQGTYNNGANGLIAATAGFGGYGLNAFDRSALVNLGQTLRLKSTIPAAGLNVPSRPSDGLYWNSNAPNTGFGTSGHDSVVNFLPWEVPPTPYSVGINSSQDYPDIAPGNVTQNAISSVNSASAGDLTSNSVTLPQGVIGTASNNATPIQNRTVYGDPIQIKITVPNHQPANQQLYQQGLLPVTGGTGGSLYDPNGQIAPVTSTGTNNINSNDQAFPMGYVASKRLFVPSATGRYSAQRPYRDFHIYTGVAVDIRTSIANPTTDIGQVPAAFGVQTEQYTPLSYFTPYSAAVNTPNPFLNYFKPLEVHNDGNVNLLNAHFDQKYTNFNNGSNQTLLMNSDAVDPLSALLGYDFPGSTGPRPAGELPFLIRSSLDTDIFGAYGRNPYIVSNFNGLYPGATFHKPRVGSDQPSTLTVPDAPESYFAGASLTSSPMPLVPNGINGVNKSAPFVSVAIPFGTPVGTYRTQAQQSPLSLRLFEGLDAGTAAARTAYSTTSALGFLYPPQYKGAVGGIGSPSLTAGQTLTDTYTAGQPLSTTGTQLSATVIEQRLTDGVTYGEVPMIDAGPAGPVTTVNGSSQATSAPDFAPAAFRDPASGDLSVYWTSGRGAGYGIYGANVPFKNDNTGAYFFPSDPTKNWWNSTLLLPSTTGANPTANSGLSISAGSPAAGSTLYAFDVYSANAPYTNILYSYSVTPDTGKLTAQTQLSPLADDSQVKYGVKGLFTGTSLGSNASANWAFWTANTRGRTALYYSPQSAWGTNSYLLPVPAGLTAVSDASPLLMTAPAVIAGSLTYNPVIEVTYSGTGPDGNADLYASRYLPDAKTPAQLDLVPFPAVTENLKLQGNTGWYQGRDTAWSRSGALNITVPVTSSTGNVTTVTQTPLLYGATTPFAPKFTKAIYDKASGYLVLTGVTVPYAVTPATGQNSTTNTVYVDAATGRIRFSPALLPTQNFAAIQATFSPLARRLTTDSRADVGPVTFLDNTPKPNDAAGVLNSQYTANVSASRRWTIWRKSGVAGVGSTATLYFKTQRLTLFLPPTLPLVVPMPTIDVTKPVTVTFNGNAVTGFDVDFLRNRLYFPIGANLEGQQVTVTYTDSNGVNHTGTGTNPAIVDTVQWQDEAPVNALPASNDIVPGDSISGLDTVIDTLVPIQTATNENNVTAFLDPFAGMPAVNGSLNPHKVWLFWNSTRNGTADIYSETIDPRFAPGPTTP